MITGLQISEMDACIS